MRNRPLTLHQFALQPFHREGDRPDHASRRLEDDAADGLARSSYKAPYTQDLEVVDRVLVDASDGVADLMTIDVSQGCARGFQ